MQGAEGELAELATQIANADELIIKQAKDEERRERWQRRLDELEKRQLELKEQCNADRMALREASAQRDSFAEWQRNLPSLKRAIAQRKAVEPRVRLHHVLREFIAKIEVFADGSPQLEDPADIGLRRPNALPYCATVKQRRAHLRLFKEYCRDICKRRMTREGRFYRVHFKSGRSIDVVPAGSIASGLSADGQGYTEPDFKQLEKKQLASGEKIRVSAAI